MDGRPQNCFCDMRQHETLWVYYFRISVHWLVHWLVHWREKLWWKRKCRVLCVTTLGRQQTKRPWIYLHAPKRKDQYLPALKPSYQKVYWSTYNLPIQFAPHTFIKSFPPLLQRVSGELWEVRFLKRSADFITTWGAAKVPSYLMLYF